MKKAALIFLCSLSVSKVFSQQVDYMTGRLIDTTSMRPVPFATIRLKNNLIGVFANADGEFRIPVKNQFRADSLIISCIGFTSKTLGFNDLNSTGNNRIYLTPITYKLSEVKVSARKRIPGSIVIISRAIKNMKQNYPLDSFSYVAYYRDYQKEKSNYINLNEGIIQALDKGFNSQSSENKYRLLSYRKNTDFPQVPIVPFYDTSYSQQFSNEYKTVPGAIIHDNSGNELFILRAHDAIRNYNAMSFSFIDTLSSSLLRNHLFSDPVYAFEGSMLLYRIDFRIKPKLIADTLDFRGSVYIRLKDYSIHKLEYSGYYLNGAGNKKEMYSIRTEYGYNPAADSLMYLKYISFSNIFQVPDSTDTKYFSIYRSYFTDIIGDNLNMVVEFNRNIDPASARKRENYDIRIGERTPKITKLEVIDNKLSIEIKNDNFEVSKDSASINIRNVKDLNGNLINKRRSIEIYQFRELFVLENNKDISFRSNCFMDYAPLQQSCTSQTDSIVNYWMNTPQQIGDIEATKSQDPNRE